MFLMRESDAGKRNWSHSISNGFSLLNYYRRNGLKLLSESIIILSYYSTDIFNPDT